MPRKSKAVLMAELHQTALNQFEASWLATCEDRKRAVESRRFVNIRGGQWEWDAAGDFRNKIKFEIDHISTALTRIKNEYRRNRIMAKFLPADGSDADALSEALAGRYRADTMDATGREARDMAFDSAVEGGMGGLRLRAEYEDGTKQRICLEPINDAETSLFFDVNAKRKDKSDARHAFYVEPWTTEAYKAEWGESAASWPEHLLGKYTYQWFGAADLIMVAEYFVKEDRKFTYRRWQFLDEVEEIRDDLVTAEDEMRLGAQGFAEIESRVEEGTRVLKYIMNGATVLAGPEVIPGDCIPLVPQYGHRTVIQHIERFRGHVLKSMDPQIAYNMQVSKVAQTAAASVDAKPIFLTEQIAAYAQQWSDAHREDPPYLQIASILDANGNIMPSGPVGYLTPPDVAPAVAALIALTKQDISEQMGNQENGEQVGPQVSGVALELAQGWIDMQSYGYMDNAADAERRIAEIYQGMAAVLYGAEVEGNEGRKLKTMSEDMRRGQVEIGRKVLDAKTGRMDYEVDFSRARFDVEVDIGPTSASKRSAVVRTITGLLGQVPEPQMQVVLAHTALMNLEAEGMRGVREWSRKQLVGMGVEKPTREEQAEMDAAQGQQQPDAQAQLAGALAQEAQAKAAKAVADTALAEARTQETQAQTAKTLASIPIDQQRAALATAQAIMNAEGQNDLG